jgi:hypothetical protein
MLRDAGIDAYTDDPHMDPFYARGFTASLASAAFDLVTAIEVLEHLPNPAETMATVFAASPRAILATTELYAGQGADWPYLSAETGQHVFFYSETGLRLIAERHGYRFTHQAGYLLFSREDVPRAPLQRQVITMTQLLMPLFSTKGARYDAERLARTPPP